jgi:hypothetical protein
MGMADVLEIESIRFQRCADCGLYVFLVEEVGKEPRRYQDEEARYYLTTRDEANGVYEQDEEAIERPCNLDCW